MKPDDFRGFQVSASAREQAINKSAIANHKNLNSVRLFAFKAGFFMRDAFAATFVDDFMLIVPVIIQITLLGTCAGFRDARVMLRVGICERQLHQGTVVGWLHRWK